MYISIYLYIVDYLYTLLNTVTHMSLFYIYIYMCIYIYIPSNALLSLSNSNFLSFSYVLMSLSILLDFTDASASSVFLSA
jgi:hypothetical protein